MRACRALLFVSISSWVAACGGDDPEPRSDAGSRDATTLPDMRSPDAAPPDDADADSAAPDGSIGPDAPSDCVPLSASCFIIGAGGCCSDPVEKTCVGGEWTCPPGRELVDRCMPCGDVDAGPPPGDWASCEVPSQCGLQANTCCGVCGVPTLADVDGVNMSRTDEHFDAVCPMPVPCPACPTGLNPALQVTCADARCAPFDVRESPVSACTRDEDCRVRVTQCCECGGDTSPGALIAISSESMYSSLVCDPLTGCPECAPVYPEDVRAVCAPDGHCRIAGDA